MLLELTTYEQKMLVGKNGAGTQAVIANKM